MSSQEEGTSDDSTFRPTDGNETMESASMDNGMESSYTWLGFDSDEDEMESYYAWMTSDRELGGSLCRSSEFLDFQTEINNCSDTEVDVPESQAIEQYVTTKQTSLPAFEWKNALPKGSKDFEKVMSELTNEMYLG